MAQHLSLRIQPKQEHITSLLYTGVFGYSGNVEECIRGAKALLNANGFNKSLEIDKKENSIRNGLP
ncbi:Hypothetical protein SynWH7803_1503 [Synechococcus sp. WH 7803]|nr:Hypothetical protein SynWH7803_1503 [Synechococcus sp. WH 7803]